MTILQDNHGGKPVDFNLVKSMEDGGNDSGVRFSGSHEGLGCGSKLGTGNII